MPQIRVFMPDGSQPVHELSEETLTLGRLPDNAIQIEDGSVSSHHGEIAYTGSGYELRDNGSTNGTFVNGEQTAAVTLKDGDRLRFGSIEAVFAIGVANASAGGSQPLPQAERAPASFGSASARPAGFANASPFPKPKEKADPFAMAAIILAVLGAIGFAASVYLSMGLSATGA